VTSCPGNFVHRESKKYRLINFNAVHTVMDVNGTEDRRRSGWGPGQGPKSSNALTQCGGSGPLRLPANNI